jgi:hypothetical protein
MHIAAMLSAKTSHMRLIKSRSSKSKSSSSTHGRVQPISLSDIGALGESRPAHLISRSLSKG